MTGRRLVRWGSLATDDGGAIIMKNATDCEAVIFGKEELMSTLERRRVGLTGQLAAHTSPLKESRASE